MIYITGDTHGDLGRFSQSTAKKLKQNDNLIICGDFGFIWNGSEQETKILNSIGKHKYKVFFVDGKHENFDLLNKYKIIDRFGGKIRHISGNLFHMIRGQIYTIENKNIFTFGGGESPDKDIRISSGTWWPQEMPSSTEMQNALENLKSYNQKINYIITHEPPAFINKMMYRNHNEINQLKIFLDFISKEIEFEKWFFGCTHINRKITFKYYSIFNDIIPVEKPLGKRHFKHKNK